MSSSPTTAAAAMKEEESGGSEVEVILTCTQGPRPFRTDNAGEALILCRGRMCVLTFDAAQASSRNPPFRSSAYVGCAIMVVTMVAGSTGPSAPDSQAVVHPFFVKRKPKPESEP